MPRSSSSKSTRRAIQFAYTLDGRYQIEFGGGTLLLDLENLSRDFDRDDDPERIVRYLDSTLAAFAPLPSWGEARSRIFWSAEPSNTELREALHERVTDRVARVLVFADFDQGLIRWLSPKCQEAWRVTTSELDMAARENLERLLRGKQLNVARDNHRALGMVPLDSEAEVLKASIIFAPGLRAFVEADIGWPVLAVIPCRDFIYLFGEGSDVLSVIGPIVQREFRSSGYPITTEVLRISDEGIKAIGCFPE